MEETFDFNTWNYKSKKKKADNIISEFKPRSITNTSKVSVFNPILDRQTSKLEEPNYKQVNIPSNINEFHQSVISKNTAIQKIIKTIPTNISNIILPVNNEFSTDVLIDYNNLSIPIKNQVISNFKSDILINDSDLELPKYIIPKSTSNIIEGNFNTAVSVTNVEETVFIQKNKLSINNTPEIIDLKNKSIINPTSFNTERYRSIVQEVNNHLISNDISIVEPSLELSKQETPIDIIDYQQPNITSEIKLFNNIIDLKESDIVETNYPSIRDTQLKFGSVLYLYTNPMSIAYGYLISKFPNVITGEMINTMKDLGGDELHAAWRNVVNGPLIHALNVRNKAIHMLKNGVKLTEIATNGLWEQELLSSSLSQFNSTWLIDKDPNHQRALNQYFSTVPLLPDNILYNPLSPESKSRDNKVINLPMHPFQFKQPSWMLEDFGKVKHYSYTEAAAKLFIGTRYGKGSLIDKAINARKKSEGYTRNKFLLDNIFYGPEAFFHNENSKYIMDFAMYNTDSWNHTYQSLIPQEDRTISVKPQYGFIYKEYQKLRQTLKFEIGKIGSNGEMKNKIKLPDSVKLLSDTLTGQHSTLDFIGRHDPVFRYNIFTRSISIKFSLFADTPTHNIINHHMMNELNKLVLPKYSGSRKNVVLLTLGDYFENQTCIIKSITITPENGIPWETKMGGYDFDIAKGYHISLGIDVLQTQIDNTQDTIGSKKLREYFKEMSI